jgi:hypothetical protein
MNDPDVETVGEPAPACYIRTLALPATAKRFSASAFMFRMRLCQVRRSFRPDSHGYNQRQLMNPAKTCLLSVVICASAAEVVTSKLYWGYWTTPPSSDSTVTSLASVDRYTYFPCCAPSRSGVDAMAELAKFESRVHGDIPTGNLPAALIRRQLTPSRSVAIASDVLDQVRTTMRENGLLVDSSPEYPYADTLWGHLAVGSDRTGGTVAIAGLWSGEISNDHHVYYEAAFSISPTGQLRLLRWHRRYYDFAGLEGIAHWLAASGAGAFGAIGWAVVTIVLNARRTASMRT